jgi:hypothetical protein
MQLQETCRQVTEDKKHAATGDLQTGDRRQETCSYRRQGRENRQALGTE